MYLGIDVGGTNIAAAIIDENFEMVKRTHTPTRASEGRDAVVEAILLVCNTLISGESVPKSIGIGIPGAVDNAKGEIIYTPNLPISGLKIAEIINEQIDCPVMMQIVQLWEKQKPEVRKVQVTLCL